MIIKIDKLLKLQSELDKLIFANNKTDYDKTKTFRRLAILVEIGEFANELKVFKFWSKHAKIHQQNALDELVDVMHFLLSSLLETKITIDEITIPNENYNELNDEQKNQLISDKLIELYTKVCGIDNGKKIIEALVQLITIGLAVGFSWEMIKEAYKNKNLVNIERQNKNY